MNIRGYGKQQMWQGLVADANTRGARLSVTNGVNELVSLPLSTPMQYSIVSGKLVFNTIPKALILQSGIPTVAHLIIGSATALDLEVGVDLMLDKPSVQAGGYLNIQALSITI
ncbi:hypothetical protein [Psychrobacter sp. ANT_WB68]|uniref:hypothetical protein n=1 Tax=Psychrobacter sp. ANT_WB68 TaxID=2597355 RepID=UPI0011F1EFD8|nr:hypothetical protein [Psychrobacter sp. ANT_WB68]KAA0915819.1 hypothetical protein FQ084_04605 [Psychrobacter sp. ANT_WB68]